MKSQNMHISIQKLDLSNTGLQVLNKNILSALNTTHLNVKNNPITHISGELMRNLKNLQYFQCDWCIYIQEGDLEKRSLVSLSSNYSINKFINIFEEKEAQEEKHSIFKINSS